MSLSILRRSLLALALVAGLAANAAAQPARLQGFPTADAAATALTDAIRRDDDKAVAAMLGAGWRDFVPGSTDDESRLREKYLAAWDANHKVVVADDAKATVEVGTTGWTLPVPIIKEGAEWRYDVAAGLKEIQARQIGRNNTMKFAKVPSKIGAPVYARRLLSSPGKKDGLYWEHVAGQPESPLGPALALAQARGQGGTEEGGYYGYHFRLLYAQGPAAPGGAYDYLVNGRMMGGFAVIAWPVRYDETGVMTFIVSQSGDVYEQDLGPETAQRAAAIHTFNPDKGWDKADMTPP